MILLICIDEPVFCSLKSSAVTFFGMKRSIVISADPQSMRVALLDAGYKSLLPGETRLCRMVSWKPGKSWDRCRFVSLF